MRNLTLSFMGCFLLLGCSDIRDEELPQKIEQLEALKPKMEDLTFDEQGLLTGYLFRKTLSAGLAGKELVLPQGVTIGQAIEEQKNFLKEQKDEEDRQNTLKLELVKKQAASTKQMRDAVTVTLISKSIEPEYGMSSVVIDENLSVSFGYRNNTAKNIVGVKGLVSIKDLFGDEISAFAISNDMTILPGQSVLWEGHRSVQYAFGNNNDRKLAELDESKYKVVWDPEMIIFEDGAKLTLPTN